MSRGRSIAALAAAAAAAVMAAPVMAAAGPAAPRLGDERVLLRTTRGDLVLGLYPEVAPRHVAQILGLVRLGVYDSTWFHRIEPGYVVQLSNAQNRRVPMAAAQASAIRKLPAEFSALPHRAGVLSMAREDGDVDSAETSFSILLAAAPHLNGKYTVFGELVWGNDVLAAMAASPRDENNRPVDEIRVESALVKTEAEIERMRAAGRLRTAIAAPPVRARREARGGGGGGSVVVAGIAIMMILGLGGFLLAGRLPPHRVSAFSLLIILVGAFLLLREFGPLVKGSAPLATAVFFGIVALFKLMNRFESARPNAPAPSAAAAPAVAAATGAAGPAAASVGGAAGPAAASVGGAAGPAAAPAVAAGPAAASTVAAGPAAAPAGAAGPAAAPVGGAATAAAVDPVQPG